MLNEQSDLMIKSIATYLLITFLCVPAASANDYVDSVRVYHIERNTFDYVLTGRVIGGKTPVLSFNDFDGNTRFVKIGKKLGDYKVISYSVEEEKAEKPVAAKPGSETRRTTVKAKAAKEQGIASLRDADGDFILLEQDKKLRRSGWLARLVSLETGRRWRVRTGDVIEMADGSIRIDKISKDTVKINSGASSIPIISTQEKIELTALYKQLQLDQKQRHEQVVQQLTERRMAEGLANRQIIERQIAGAALANTGSAGNGQVGGINFNGVNARLVSNARQPASLYVGTEALYPTEFDTFYTISTNGGIGNLHLVPRSFEMRRTGIEMDGSGNFTYRRPITRDYADFTKPMFSTFSIKHGR